MSGEQNRQRNVVYVTGSGYQCTPVNAGVTTTAGTSPNFGSWVELMRPDFDVFVLGVHVGPSTAPGADLTWLQLELGLGESSLEVTAWAWKHLSVDNVSAAGTNYWYSAFFPRALRVPAGQRLAVRSAANTTSFAVLTTALWVYDKDVRVMK